MINLLLISILLMMVHKFCWTLQAALRVNHYNVVLRLLKKITDNGRLQTLNDKRQNLFHILALFTKPGVQTDVQLKVRLHKL